MPRRKRKTDNWKTFYEEMLLKQVIAESIESSRVLDDDTFEKYVEYIALMSRLEDTPESIIAENDVLQNHELRATIITDEWSCAHKRFKENALKQQQR